MTENEYLLKMNILGGSLDLRYKIVDAFRGTKRVEDITTRTLGVDILTKKVEIGDSVIKLIIVITAGEEFFGKLRPSYYRGSSACVFLFDKSSLEDFNAIEWFYNEYRKHIPDPSIPITLVGVIGKPQEVVSTEAPFIRLEESEEIKTEQGQTLADKLGIEYVETTVHDVKTIKSIFYNLMQKVLDQKASYG
ncbi:MAG: hypothetical protein ACFFDT_27895 [Candidatus Hodarchaeota archaeon]